ncbi:MAG TPA: 6-hydroxymethylpterin diphosphokinase MptE-like protein [Spirochaetia bacterium]|nr:6-hydroxymethylpterin diphosphokinase MptE-like protein [Spirochaetia bacterium]
MDKNQILKRNLLALSSRDPELSARLSSTHPDIHTRFLSARSGHLIPARRVGDRILSFHSRFDPVREGLRYIEEGPEPGYVIFFGLGGGYHIAPFLENNQSFRLLIIEKDLTLMRAILEQIDLRTLLMDPRLKILVDARPQEVQQTVLTDYIPTLAGNLKTVSLHARVRIDEEYYQSVLHALKGIIEQVANDYSVQTQFGKRWFINTLANLAKAETAAQTFSPARRILITGAGPSLEDQIEQIKELKNDSFLIATDTSLPFLLAFDVKPEAVISIDCQQISYRHFLGGYPEDVPLVLDLASPPLLSRLSQRLFFFASNHPFSQYIADGWRNLPMLDTSGGNVSHSAFSLANLLEADEIYLFGLDFSFPDGKSYARNTYVYPYFRANENRTTPLETFSYTLLHRNEDTTHERIGQTIRFTTPTMLGYKEKLENAIMQSRARVISVEGRGIPLVIRQSPERLNKQTPVRTILSQGVRKTSWQDFLHSYLEDIRALPRPVRPFANYWQNLSVKAKRVWLTQLPAAAALKGEVMKGSFSSAELLELTKDWTISILNRYVR